MRRRPWAAVVIWGYITDVRLSIKAVTGDKGTVC